MTRWPMFLALAGLGLLLAGCGGGDGDGNKANDSPAKLTSQTVTGQWTGSQSSSITPSADFSSQITAYIDTDELNVRIDGAITSKGLNITSPQPYNIILHAAKKMATLHLSFSKTLPFPMPFPPCVSVTLDSVPPVEILRALLKDKLESQKPDGMDGAYRQWKFDTPAAAPAGVSLHAYMDLDGDNGFRKGYEAMKVDSNGTQVQSETTFTATDVKIGKPDAAVFTVPKEWGDCKKVLDMAAPPSQHEHAQLAAVLLAHVGAVAPMGLAAPRPKGADAVMVV